MSSFDTTTASCSIPMLRASCACSRVWPPLLPELIVPVLASPKPCLKAAGGAIDQEQRRVRLRRACIGDKQGA